MTYYVGDVVTCRVSDDGREVIDHPFDDAKYRNCKSHEFEILGQYQEYYIIRVPNGKFKDSFEITQELAAEHSIDPKHCGGHGCLVKEFAIGCKTSILPQACCCCKQYFQYAAPNQEDGRFACWSCKTDPRYRLIHDLK